LVSTAGADIPLIQAGVSINIANGHIEDWYTDNEDNYIEEPVPGTFAAGDVVTVTITQQSPGQWLIELMNDTTG
jgi:hypothetical protein